MISERMKLQTLRIFLRQDETSIESNRFSVSTYTMKKAQEFKELNAIQGWDITNVEMNYKIYDHPLKNSFYDGFELVFEIERKSRYYVFKIIMPIILILIVCWAAGWIKPKDLESKLTITIEKYANIVPTTLNKGIMLFFDIALFVFKVNSKELLISLKFSEIIIIRNNIKPK